MGRLILISGENNSGKSVYAEWLVGQTQGKRYYIATMRPKTEDNFLRIRKHRQHRREYDFLTLELPYQVGHAPVTSDSVVLLEDVSNLLANNMFETGKGARDVFCDICDLQKRCGLLIAVTIDGIDDGAFEGKTAKYIKSLNRLNQMLFKASDQAVGMQNGHPALQKGEENAFF